MLNCKELYDNFMDIISATEYDYDKAAKWHVAYRIQANTLDKRKFYQWYSSSKRDKRDCLHISGSIKNISTDILKELLYYNHITTFTITPQAISYTDEQRLASIGYKITDRSTIKDISGNKFNVLVFTLGGKSL